MEIQDRDYYRTPRANVSPLRRPKRQPSTAQLALFWIAVMAIMFAAFHWGPRAWRSAPRSTPAPVASPPAQPTPASPALPPANAAAGTTPLETRRAVPPAAAPIYRCGSNYSHDPCPGGRAIDGPVASGFDSRPSERLARLVAEGRSADRNTATAVNGTVTTITRYDSGAGSSASADRGDGCRSLANEIADIDRAARQPLYPAEQDRLRARRQHARDEQAALHC